MIYAIMIVGDGEAERYLRPVLERVLGWADGIYVGIEPGTSSAEMAIVSEFADAWGELKCSASENEGMAKTQAWLDMAHALRPTTEDLISFIKPTEVLLNYEAIRHAAVPGFGMLATVNHLWDSDHIRIDGSWAPRDELMFIPYVANASYADYRLRVGRFPTYHYKVRYNGVPVSDVLDYDMMTFKDKIRKWDWFDRVGALDFFSIDHITSMNRTPTLRTWKKGGILNAGVH